MSRQLHRVDVPPTESLTPAPAAASAPTPARPALHQPLPACRTFPPVAFPEEPTRGPSRASLPVPSSHVLVPRAAALLLPSPASSAHAAAHQRMNYGMGTIISPTSSSLPTSRRRSFSQQLSEELRDLFQPRESAVSHTLKEVSLSFTNAVWCAE